MDYFFKIKQYEKAAALYKTVMEYCVEQHSRTNTSMMTDLKWADCMLQLNLVAQFEKAYELVEQYPQHLLQTPAQQFYHAELGALLCDRMYKKTEAMEFAGAAVRAGALLQKAPAGKNKEVPAAMENRVKKMTALMEAKEL